jgi:riboflavin synthase
VFTGIIEDLGEIRQVAALEKGKRLAVATCIPVSELSLGESITINGACMTVTAIGESGFEIEVSSESLRRTTLGELRVGDRVNLERSIRMTDRLGGHLVSGHVDGTGIIDGIYNEGESAIFRFRVPNELTVLLVEKGSVAVDGISLTCFACTAETFDVAVIPHTAAVTTLGRKKIGDRVNIENDVLAKYVERLVRPIVEARCPSKSET